MHCTSQYFNMYFTKSRLAIRALAPSLVPTLGTRLVGPYKCKMSDNQTSEYVS